MSNRTRAFRRHHRNRMIKNGFRKFILSSPNERSWVEHYISRNYNNLTTCSCPMCGNPRHNRWVPHKETLTLQERKVYNVLHEELEDYYTDCSNVR